LCTAVKRRLHQAQILLSNWLLAALLAFAPFASDVCSPVICAGGGEPGVYAPDPTATVSRPEAELRVRSDKRALESAAGAEDLAHVEVFLLERPFTRSPDSKAVVREIASRVLFVFAARAPPQRTKTA
jgi:hypothetical protein